jgi:hypothetical protein
LLICKKVFGFQVYWGKHMIDMPFALVSPCCTFAFVIGDKQESISNTSSVISAACRLASQLDHLSPPLSPVRLLFVANDINEHVFSHLLPADWQVGSQLD